jgi:DNA-binding NtrC family response regulator
MGVPVPAERAVFGRDPNLLSVLERARRIAPTRSSVLVLGETGTGKELFARLLHELGPHPEGPYVAVNCGALSRELAESELFGHERGAFTGAASRREGWFEEASGGTLVLDEVGELPAALQPKLLRVLETGCLRRVGGRGEIPVRVRIVALTLRDLHREARDGSFRLDLYHRLAGFEIRLPALRDRPTDIVPLAEHLLGQVADEVGPRALTDAARVRLASHRWPGNVRELRNVIRRAAFLSEGVIDGASLEMDDGLAHRPLADRAGEAVPGESPAAQASHPDLLPMAGRSYRELERQILGWALRRHGGSRRRAAQALGISRSTFCDRVKRLGLTS